MAVIWLSGFGDSTLADPAFVRWIPNRDLRAALGVVAHGIDAAWLVLGAINLYLALVRTEGIAVARRWSVMVLATGFALPAISAFTDWPLGPVFYPQNLGLKIGPVPFGVPLLWLVMVLGAREASWRFLPRSGHGTLACATGLLVLLTDIILEPLAWKYRAWWLWYPGPGAHPAHAPWTNFLSWLVAGGGLAWAMRTPHVAPRVTRQPISPVAAILFLNGLALSTHLALRWR